MTTAPARIYSSSDTYRWLPLRLYNAVADRVPPVAGSLGRVDELHDEATRATGLTDFGDPAYRPALEALHAAFGAEADLTAAGRRFARGAMVGALTNRLTIQRELSAEPDIARRAVGPAIVVLGLPRSGTTLLQNLLALDPANRSLRQWEASTPAPPPLVGAESTDPRVRASERVTWLLDHIAPAARVLHPTGPRLPTECVTLFANSFASLELSAIYQVPSYTDWVLSADMRPHYAYYATQLRLLAWHDHRERWSLKSPAHLFWVDELVQALPEARIVALHRNPAEVLGSFCSLASVMAATNARVVDRDAIGTFWVKTWAGGVARAEQARRGPAGSRVRDLRYADLVADPVGAVAGLYQSWDFQLSDSFVAAMRDYLGRNPQHRGGAHRYSLTDFGWSGDAVQDIFAAAGPERWR